MDWSSVFVPAVPLAETFVRGTVMFLALLVMLRVVGQREAGGLGLTDLLVVVLVAQAASGGLSGGTSTVTDGLLLVATILFWSVAVDAVAYRSPRAARVLKARPRTLVRRGDVDQRALRREFMTRDEVLSQLRLHGITDPADVEEVVLEPNGMISVVRRDPGSPDQPVPPAALP